MSKKSFELHFEKKNGVLSTVLSPETYSALLEAPCCIPYSKNGKRACFTAGHISMKRQRGSCANL